MYKYDRKLLVTVQYSPHGSLKVCHCFLEEQKRVYSDWSYSHPCSAFFFLQISSSYKAYTHLAPPLGIHTHDNKMVRGRVNMQDVKNNKKKHNNNNRSVIYWVVLGRGLSCGWTVWPDWRFEAVLKQITARLVTDSGRVMFQEWAVTVPREREHTFS